MIKQETAQGIADICEKIDLCIQVLDLFKQAKKQPEINMNVALDEDDEGITVQLTDEIAEKAVKKQIEFLKDEYAAYNKKALEEAGA